MLSIDLSEKVVVVTGCLKGIGLGVAKMFAKAGSVVAGCDLEKVDSADVQHFIKLVSKDAPKVRYHKTDVTNAVEIAQLVSSLVAEFGRIDYLISNAGANLFTAPEMCDEAFWDKNSDVNLKAHWMMAKACYPYLKANEGTIILMGSNHAYSSIPNCFPYNVTKLAIDGLVKSLAIQWGPEIRVVGLAPGYIETEGMNGWLNTNNDPIEKRNEIINIHPLKKFGTVEEIGTMCAFLCSPMAGFVTGTTYLIDGGRSAVMQDV